MVNVPSPVTFEVKTGKAAPPWVFVYGKEVADFLSVHYDRIFTTGISAIQELSRQADQQAEILRRSEARVAELEQKASKLAELEQKVSKLAGLEGELAEMKKLLARLSEPRKETCPAAEVPANEK